MLPGNYISEIIGGRRSREQRSVKWFRNELKRRNVSSSTVLREIDLLAAAQKKQRTNSRNIH